MEEANIYQVLERIANALERQNALLENQERRSVIIDNLDAKLKKYQLNETKSPITPKQ